MTFGAIVLWMMSGEPIPPSGYIAAMDNPCPQTNDVVLGTEQTLRPAKWRHIVIHADISPTSPTAKQCHFIVSPDGQVSATDRWKRQEQGLGVGALAWQFNLESISICLIGEFSIKQPSRRQFDALVTLARILQTEPFAIGPGHVYLRSDLDAYSDLPGPAFHVERFAKGLYRNHR